MDIYKGENIKISLLARIHPTDRNIPDCKCILALSERHLFVIEDNYDGTYTDHYVIDVNYIDDIIMSEFDKDEKKPEPGSAADQRERADTELLRKHPLRRLYVNNGPKKYLEVIYNDDNFLKQHLYFDECDNLPKGFIKAFKTLK